MTEICFALEFELCNYEKMDPIASVCSRRSQNMHSSMLEMICVFVVKDCATLQPDALGQAFDRRGQGFTVHDNPQEMAILSRSEVHHEPSSCQSSHESFGTAGVFDWQCFASGSAVEAHLSA